VSEATNATKNQGTERGTTRRPYRRYYSRPKTCQFCTDKTIVIDHKNIDLLRRFVMDDGRIRPRKQTGTCAKHQRKLAKAVKRARHIALLPFSSESLR